MSSCWWDGGTKGPIVTRWSVKGYPYVYVLDAKGVIRYQNVRNEDIDESVAELIEKVSK